MIAENPICPLMTSDASHPVLCTSACMWSLPCEAGCICAVNEIALAQNRVSQFGVRTFPTKTKENIND